MNNTEIVAPWQPSLAAEINAEHRAVEAAARSALVHAIRAGKLLAEAKQRVGHGGWGNWLAAHFEGSERTAQLYMRVYERQDLLEANPQRVTDLSLREAARLLARPKAEEPAVAEWLPAVDEQAEGHYQINGETRVVMVRRATEGEGGSNFIWIFQLVSFLANPEGGGIMEGMRRPVREDYAKDWLSHQGCSIPAQIQWEYLSCETPEAFLAADDVNRARDARMAHILNHTPDPFLVPQLARTRCELPM